MTVRSSRAARSRVSIAEASSCVRRFSAVTSRQLATRPPRANGKMRVSVHRPVVGLKTSRWAASRLSITRRRARPISPRRRKAVPDDPAEELFAVTPEEALGRAVEEGDPPIRVERVDRITDTVEDLVRGHVHALRRGTVTIGPRAGHGLDPPQCERGGAPASGPNGAGPTWLRPPCLTEAVRRPCGAERRAVRRGPGGVTGNPSPRRGMPLSLARPAGPRCDRACTPPPRRARRRRP